MPLFMLWILPSNVPSRVMSVVHKAYIIIISQDGIPLGLGGIDCTGGGASEVLVASVSVVFVCLLGLEASTVSG